MNTSPSALLGNLIDGFGWRGSGSDDFGRQVPSCKRCQHAIRKPRREVFRPLADRGLADTNGFSSGSYGAAQELNGFGLVHGYAV